MLLQKQPVARPVYKKSYRDFRGVDMTSAITEVDDSRSPNAPNMIADESGFPCKRCGHEKFLQLDGAINGLHKFKGLLFVHAGAKLYKCTLSGKLGEETWSVESAAIYEDMADSKSVSFIADGCMYILDGKRMLKVDGDTAKPADDGAYVPTTAISMPPEGGGKDYEAINLLSPYRINSFLGKADAVEYTLDAKGIDAVTKVELMGASGDWAETTAYTADLANGKVTFTTAPGASPVTGEDNVKITYKKTVEGYADRINKCRICALYGIGNDNRIFVSGNPDYKNMDWYCESGRPDYFTDTSYSCIGGESTAIMGYLRQYDSLVIVKEPTDGNEATVYLRSATMNDKNEASFLVRQGIAGAGAVSMYAVGNFNDDNVFLAEDGLKGLDTQQVSQQRVLQERAHYVSLPLKREAAKENAVMVCGGGYLYLFINGHAYIADGKQRTKNPSGSFGYEWFYWTDIPAKSAVFVDGRLYIGDDTGGVYYFKDEETFNMAAYSDSDATTGEKQPIYAAWSTKMDRLTDSSVFKKITKTGTGVFVKPYARTNGTICYVTGDAETDVKEYSLTTTFDFDDVDFNAFDFGALPSPYFVPARKKKKKAKVFQMVVENGAIDSAFGLYEMRVNYILCGHIKK